ncbi:MAG: magnesium transporter, partial [Candidatus Kariarchaeaceae archaeon]
MSTRYTVEGIVKQSLPVLYGVTLLSMFTGASFEHIFTNFFSIIPAIIIVLPAFIHLSGDISDVFSARLSTMLYKGDINYNFKPFRLYFLNCAAIGSVACTGFVFISIAGNIVSLVVFDQNEPWLKFIFVILFAGILSVMILIMIASVLTRYAL